jgi:hypothetical protein
LKTLKTVLIALAVTALIIALGIISCTVQLARGVNAVVNEPSIEVKDAVTQTERAMVIAPDAITITLPLVRNTQSDGYHTEIGIGQTLATALGITLQYKPFEMQRVDTTDAEGRSTTSFHSQGGGIASRFGSNDIAGSGDKKIERTAQSHYTDTNSTATGSGIRLTLDYDTAVTSDECTINGKLVKLQFIHTGF